MITAAAGGSVRQSLFAAAENNLPNLEQVLSNEWDEYADGWDIDPAVEAYASKVFASLEDKFSLEGKIVLDFGCGTGALTKLISPRVKNVVAIDPSPKMIGHLRNKCLPNVVTIAEYLSEDLTQKHHELECKFDLIVASSVCGFLPDYEGTLSLLKSLLKDGGAFVQWDWLSVDDSSGMGLSEKRVKQAFDANHFVNTKITSPFVMNSSKGSMPVLMACGENA